MAEKFMSMETKKLKKYLGMAVHFTYYHHSRLRREKVFEDDYCEQLHHSADKEYWLNMVECLEYALQQENYCLDIIDSPMKERYSEEDIKLFFEKFYVFLKDCVTKNSI